VSSSSSRPRTPACGGLYRPSHRVGPAVVASTPSNGGVCVAGVGTGAVGGVAGRVLPVVPHTLVDESNVHALLALHFLPRKSAHALPLPPPLPPVVGEVRVVVGGAGVGLAVLHTLVSRLKVHASAALHALPRKPCSAMQCGAARCGAVQRQSIMSYQGTGWLVARVSAAKWLTARAGAAKCPSLGLRNAIGSH
jgi:hypothetical protein